MASHKSTLTLFFFLVIMSLMWCLHRNDWTCQPGYPPAAPVSSSSSSSTFSESSIEDLFGYFHWSNSLSCRLSIDFGFWVYSGEGVSAPDGHKAVCLDPGVAPSFNNCLVYSFGINNQWAFDDAMEQFKCQVHSFDPSMGREDFDRSEHIHFHNIGLSGRNGPDDQHKGWNMNTLSSIHEMLIPVHGDIIIDVVKMDVEFAEWQAIPQMIHSGFLQSHVKQLAVEIHFLKDDPLETFQHYYRVLRLLEGSGFVRFSSRPNPWLKRRIELLDRDDYIGLELTWYNDRFYS